jgi:hypothetical protein
MCVCSEPIIIAAVLPCDNMSVLNRLDKPQHTVDRMFALLPGNLCADSAHMHTNINSDYKNKSMTIQLTEPENSNQCPSDSECSVLLCSVMCDFRWPTMVHDVCATLFCCHPSRRLPVVVELVFGKAGLSGLIFFNCGQCQSFNLFVVSTLSVIGLR